MNLGEYHIVAKLGQGGMAEVFKATKHGAQGFEKTYALKKILPPFSDKKHFIQMLFDEAHLQSQLSHPNLVQVYDFAVNENQHYLIMEYINGVSLKDLCQHLWNTGKDIPINVSIYIISQTLKALNYIHTKNDTTGPLNIVHRDLSPQNILISFDGQVKLADFGIAWSELKQNNTRSGVLKGKTSYLSPQQVLGQAVTASSDIFSSGIILYELLCKKNPFLGHTDYETMKNIENHRYMSSEKIISHAPASIHALIDSILQKPQQTLSAKDMLKQLNAIQKTPWLSEGDILLDTFLKQCKLPINQPTLTTINQTLVLTQFNTKTFQAQVNYKKYFFTFAILLSFIFLGLRFQNYFIPSTNLKTPPADNTKPLATQKMAKPSVPSSTSINQKTLKKTSSNKKIKKSIKLSSLSFMGPKASKIFIDGKLKLTLPADDLELKAGTYLIQWSLSSGQSKIKRVELKHNVQKILIWHSF